MESVNLKLNLGEASLLYIQDMVIFFIWIYITTKWGKLSLMESAWGWS